MIFDNFYLTDVAIDCTCGGAHRDHYEVRTIDPPSRYVASGCDHCSTCTGIAWQTPTVPPAPEAVFSKYRVLLKEEATRPITEWTFKANPVYRQFLEHVTQGQGQAYLDILETLPQWGVRVRSLVAEISLANDSIGTPVVANFDSLGLSCSPTNLRYTHQAFTLLNQVTKLNLDAVHILEIGGGYGGLALFTQQLATLFATTILSYTIIDVPESCRIQQQYGQHFRIRNLMTVDGTNKRAIENAVAATSNSTRYLVSAYGFSELSAEIRDWYEDTLTPHCPHGFLMWNRVAPYPLVDGDMIIVDDPVPTETGVKMVTY